MSLEKGTLTGFIGSNGAGKTTTIKSILNIIKSDDGKITVLGMNSVADDLEIKSKLGIVLDDDYFYEDLTSFNYIKAENYKLLKKHFQSALWYIKKPLFGR